MKSFLAAGVALGVVAVVLLNLYVDSTIESFRDDPGAIRLLRFTRDVPPNSKVDNEMVRPVRLPEGYEAAMSGAVKPDELPVVLGKPLPRGAKAGQYLLWSMFRGTAGGRPDSIEKILTPGMRVIPIPVDKNSAAGGWIRPGDLVDLVGTFTYPNPTGEGNIEETLVFLEKVKVVATGGLTGYSGAPDEPAPDNYPDISVLVSPADALKVVYAMEHAGRIRAFLRNPEDSRSLADYERGISQSIFLKVRPRDMSRGAPGPSGDTSGNPIGLPAGVPTTFTPAPLGAPSATGN